MTWSLRRWIKPISLRNQNVEDARSLTGRVPFGAKLPPGWQIRAGQEDALRGEWIEPRNPNCPARMRCILYLHGGGYIAMSARTHRSVTSSLEVGLASDSVSKLYESSSPGLSVLFLIQWAQSLVSFSPVVFILAQRQPVSSLMPWTLISPF